MGQIWDNIKAALNQLFSKDSMSGTSYVYSFLGDQFGHFTLGLAPTLLLMWQLNSTNWVIPFGVMMLWVIKELYDLIATIIAKPANSVFPLPLKDLAYNIGCAWTYFGIGTISAYSAYAWDLGWPIGLSLAYGIAYFYPWLVQKVRMDQSNIPFFFRLCNFYQSKILATDLITIQDIIQNKGVSVIIAGGKNSGKTILGVGMLSEHLMAGYPCHYTTFVKWVDDRDSITQNVICVDDIPNDLTYVASSIGTFDNTKTYIWIVESDSPTWQTLLHTDKMVALKSN